jgi:hypothetical protein
MCRTHRCGVKIGSNKMQACISALREIQINDCGKQGCMHCSLTPNQIVVIETKSYWAIICFLAHHDIKLQIVPISFAIYLAVCLPTCNNTRNVECICMKFCIWKLYKNLLTLSSLGYSWAIMDTLHGAAKYLLEQKMFQTKFIEKNETHLISFRFL